MGKIAFLFAGQGAQAVGMGKDLYAADPAVKSVFDMAEGIRPGTLKTCWIGPKETLDTTIHTQPCVFTMDLACAMALNAAGVRAEGVAGFSLGEVPAAAYAGVLGHEAAFRLVCARGEAMQRCAEENPGVMLAVLKLSAAEVEAACAEVSGAYPVNYNCPGQTVVACRAEAAEALSAAIAARKGRTMRLAVSGAFHSPMMADAAAALAQYLAGETLSAPALPLYGNVTAQPYGDAAVLLPMQVKRPVRWQETIERMIEDGYDTFVEVGPGKTLTGLVGKINGDVRRFNVFDAESLARTVEEVYNA